MTLYKYTHISLSSGLYGLYAAKQTAHNGNERYETFKEQQ